MNNVTNFKIEKICEKLSQIDEAIKKNFNKMDDVDFRALIDRRRHTMAHLSREIEAGTDQFEKSSTNPYKSEIEIEEAIEGWCNQVKTLKIQQISFECSNFCNLFFDHILPRSWNFDDDLLVIHQPPSIEVLEVLKSRNQKHMIIYCAAGTMPPGVIEFAGLNHVPICTSPENLERTVSLIQAPAKQVICISCESNPSVARDAKAVIADSVNAGKRTRTENTVTASKFGKSWSTNVLKNIKNFQNSKNLHQLKISGVEDAIIVASGPSLNKNVEKLAEIQDSVFIVTALRSLPILKEAGIQPDLVIQLDAENDEIAQKASTDNSHPIKNLLLEGTVNNSFFKIPAHNIIWSLPQHFFDVHERFGTKPTPFNVPSVSIYALSLCQFLKFKNICFIGQDLAASSGKQYADGATNLLPAHADISMFQIEVPGFFGDTVLTRNSYQYQIKRCSEIAKEWELQKLDLNLVNATEGGAYIPGFNHMTLETFIERRKLQIANTQKSITFSPNFFITSNVGECYLATISSIMASISNIADTIIKLDKQPTKTPGLDRKIKKTIQKFQKLNDSTSLLQIAMQDSIAKVIGTSRQIATVDSYTQFFEKVKNSASDLQAAARQQS